MEARTWLASLVLAAAASTALAGPPAGFTLAAQTDRIAFYSRGARVDVKKTEAYIDRLEQMLGQELSSRAELYRYDDPMDLARGTGILARGLTTGTTVHSALAFHPHELVHLVAVQAGAPGVFFHEGLAVAIGDEGRFEGRSVHQIARRHMEQLPVALTAFSSLAPEISYPVAGSFVTWLIESHGIDKVMTFFRSCRKSSQAPAVFARTFGEPLDAAGRRWAASL